MLIKSTNEIAALPSSCTYKLNRTTRSIHHIAKCATTNSQDFAECLNKSSPIIKLIKNVYDMHRNWFWFRKTSNIQIDDNIRRGVFVMNMCLGGIVFSNSMSYSSSSRIRTTYRKAYIKQKPYACIYRLRLNHSIFAAFNCTYHTITNNHRFGLSLFKYDELQLHSLHIFGFVLCGLMMKAKQTVAFAVVCFIVQLAYTINLLYLNTNEICEKKYYI